MALSAALCGQLHRGCECRLHDHRQRQRSFLSTPIGCAHCPERWRTGRVQRFPARSEEHTSELQSRRDLVCRLLLEKKKKNRKNRSENKIKKNLTSRLEEDTNR